MFLGANYTSDVFTSHKSLMSKSWQEVAFYFKSLASKLMFEKSHSYGFLVLLMLNFALLFFLCLMSVFAPFVSFEFFFL